MNYCLPVKDDISNSEYTSFMTAFAASTGSGLVMDLYVCRWFIVLGMAITVCYTLIYIKFMDWCAFGISWFSIVAVGISLVVGGLVFYYDGKSLDN